MPYNDIMTTPFIDWLSSEMKKRRFSQNALAKEAGVAQSVVSAVLKGDYNPSADFCVKIAPHLEADPIALLRLAGILPSNPDNPDDDSPTITQAMDVFRDLSPERQRIALALLRSLHALDDE